MFYSLKYIIYTLLDQYNCKKVHKLIFEVVNLVFTAYHVNVVKRRNSSSVSQWFHAVVVRCYQSAVWVSIYGDGGGYVVFYKVAGGCFLLLINLPEMHWYILWKINSWNTLSKLVFTAGKFCFTYSNNFAKFCRFSYFTIDLLDVMRNFCILKFVVNVNFFI